MHRARVAGLSMRGRALPATRRGGRQRNAGFSSAAAAAELQLEQRFDVGLSAAELARLAGADGFGAEPRGLAAR